ncbi:LytR family transcriptional regulator [Streptomyces sp. FBKL.4005]|uniref:LCP family protein n=1 Tax=Streptomyces tricolor TaxID=68277 RepID=A0ABS9JQR4_9ACTN|nr:MULTISPECIES: LCP family protein [Streptomyces]MCG0067909.1 LCP family protein [Streptomyces tricolor]OYP17643.1 LytR family transcriptional regulator [Streptomyces sp. FBKL.4005]BCM66877.1 putative membrane protein [Streptomyces sp. EAS-AB2608]
MNDRYDAGDAGYGAGPYEVVGYDEYGRPVYQQVPAQQPPQAQQAAYDPYAQQQGYGYDSYATGQQQPAPAYDPYGSAAPYDPYGSQAPYDPYATGTQDATGYDPYGQAASSGQQPRVTEQTAYIPQQAGPAEDTRTPRETEPVSGEPEYRTEQFAFVEEPDGDSEDVIDWLKFTENRTERREEARRRARSRIIALLVVLALFAAGGVGYLWYAGKLPGLSSSDGTDGTATPVTAQKRDVLVVHLHNTAKGGTSTALLVDNTTTKQGTTVLLPNSLALTGDDGSTTTLAKSVDDDGSSGTRDQLDTVLGTSIQGTWRLDTPYLQNLVELVGNIEVDTNTDVPDPDAKKKGTAPLVHKGQDQTLSGKMAVAYATYRAAGESQNAQLERFGQVMQGVLRKMSSDPSSATTTVQTLAQILDPPLTDKDLGAFLAKLADLAKSGDYKTALLPVQADGTLSAQTGDSVVKDILGGTAKSPDAGSAVRVSVQNATGVKDDMEKARVVLLNGGFTFLEGGSASGTQATSKVLYADAAHKADATEVAKTLGLPAGSVAKGSVSSGADVSVVLGSDYEPASS